MTLSIYIYIYIYSLSIIINKLKTQKFTNFEEFFKNSNFRFIVHKAYPESGFRTHFHASKMSAIDSEHKTTPKNVFS